MKRIRRRDFLQFGLGLGTLGLSALRYVFAAAPEQGEDLTREVYFIYLQTKAGRDAASLERVQEELKTALSAYLETLIPRDATPSAVELGGLEYLLEESSEMWTSMGGIWLDLYTRKQHGSTFAELDAVTREQVVARAAQADKGSIEHRFYQETRKVACRHYYSQPGVWPSLGFSGPPQPRGFPDFAEPPGNKT